MTVQSRINRETAELGALLRASAEPLPSPDSPDFADAFERFGDAFLQEARAFVAAVQTGGPTPSSIADAREATRLACAMREALVVG